MTCYQQLTQGGIGRAQQRSSVERILNQAELLGLVHRLRSTRYAQLLENAT
jgi:hypothetical protein